MTDSTDRLTATELALRVGIEAHRVDALAGLGVIVRDANGRFDVGDVHRVRLISAFEDVGVPLDALVEATKAGRISLAYYDQLHPAPGPLTGPTTAARAQTLWPA